MTQEERQDRINGFRAMLDWIEAHPEVEPFELRNGLDWSIYCHDHKDTFSAAVESLGDCEKVFDDDDVKAVKRFGPVSITVQAERQAVCERVQVGIEEVPVYEWKCGPFLAMPDENKAEATI